MIVVDKLVRAHVLVSGHVQGVFYRYMAAQQAQEREVAGWVRNVPDGRVEAVFEGPAGAVHALIAWCGVGSPSAEVSDVEVSWEDPHGETAFSIR